MIAGLSKTKGWLALTALFSFILFFPSLFTFYTNDDFFFLKISRAGSIGDFLNFFRLTAGPEGLGVYRLLTTQSFYFLGNFAFKMNPLGLHIVSFIAFFTLIFLIYKLTKTLSGSGYVGQICAFLYAVSATHFAHLYYLATFQELGLAIFFIISVVLFIKFIRHKDIKAYFFSLASFVAALLSKETAVVAPFVLFLVYGFMKFNKEATLKIKGLLLSSLPFFLILVFYFYMRIFYYGFARGDSYIWDASLRVVNTIFWYALWSLNLPEMVLDFVGPGLRINPKLFLFWGREIIPIFLLFAAMGVMLIILFTSLIKKLKKGEFRIYLFSLLWFILTLVPVLFLPQHKFTFYLTVPLFSVVFAIACALRQSGVKKSFVVAFLSIWSILSFMSLNLTSKTHWITQGAKIARGAYEYFSKYSESTEEPVLIEFYDTPEDAQLPWSPTQVVKVALSNDNFFKVFFGSKIALYGGVNNLEAKVVKLKARQFLNY